MCEVGQTPRLVDTARLCAYGCSMEKVLSAAEVRTIIARRCEYPATQKNAARELGVSLSYLNQVLHGRREPAGKLLEAIGLERVAGYVRRRK